MSLNRMLFTVVGNNDPFSKDEYGPVLSFLNSTSFNEVFLFCSGPSYFEKAKTIELELKSISAESSCFFIDLDLESVIDYEEIFTKFKNSTDIIFSTRKHRDNEVSILLDPGTPQMQTCWVLLSKAGILKSSLYQGIPARFSGGVYKYRKVELESSVLPDVVKRKIKTAVSADSKWINNLTPDISEGISDNYKSVFQTASRIAAYNVSVLLLGETGTGKGVFAKFIHDSSKRTANPFLPVNCSSISVTLAESELFGHVKGSFTGADRNRLGQFRAAEGGTVFLDEIGDLPLELQAKLLRVLEEKLVSPVGDEKEYSVDIRIIAATNRNIEELISEGLFRRDLYERINQVKIIIPPLKDHPEDIDSLIKLFLGKWNTLYKQNKYLESDSTELLKKYSWPGNIRQLKNSLFSMAAMSIEDRISPEHFPSEIADKLCLGNKSIKTSEINIPDDGINVKSLLYQVEKEYYIKALERSDGNREEAAKLLGINPPAFRKALKERFDIYNNGNKR